MPSIPRELATLLEQVRRPGDFYAAGTVDIHPPRLEVEGVGPIVRRVGRLSTSGFERILEAVCQQLGCVGR